MDRPPGSAARAWREFGVRLVLLVLASYGLLYFSYKFLQPWGGTADFYHYYPVYLKPLNLPVAQSPFVLRQVSAVVTHLVWKAHIFYSNQIAFHEPGLDPRVFFAALFANWVFLVLAAATAGEVAQELSGVRDQLAALLAGLLCLLSFHTQYAVLSGDTEGPAWFLLALGMLGYLRRWRVRLALILVLAIVERETLLIAFACLAVLDLLRNGADRSFKIAVCGWALACFGVYVWLRTLTGGYSHQLEVGGWVASLHRIHFGRELLFQGFLTQNVVLIAVAAWIAVKGWARDRDRMLLVLLGMLVCLYLVGFAAGIGNNAGRIAGVLTPAFAAIAAGELAELARRRQIASQSA